MSTGSVSRHGMWSNRWLFILAAAGSAVGLGNIWKFPYIAGENGGGAFVLIYLVCVAFVGIPIMMAEVLIGREGRQSPINTMRKLTEQHHKSGLWTLIGWAGVTVLNRLQLSTAGLYPMVVLGLGLVVFGTAEWFDGNVGCLFKCFFRRSGFDPGGEHEARRF